MNYLSYVNIKHGTDSQARFSNGNTLPLVALPHALAAFAPQTQSARGRWWYHPKDRGIEGIRLTHQPSPWVGDFSFFSFMPQAERAYVHADRRWSGFRPEDAVLAPHELRIDFLRYGATLRLAPTESGAVMRVDFAPWVQTPRFAVLGAEPMTGKPYPGAVEIDLAHSLITGYTTSKTDVPARNDFKCWFAFRFDGALGDPKTTDGAEARDGTVYEGPGAGANVALSGRSVGIRMAISYQSREQALFNLERETAGKTFETARAEAAAVWNGLLSKIAVSGDERRMRTFYSCMYRAFLYPTKFCETAPDGRVYHVNPETNERREGVMYTNNGFWDTYRTVYPLYSLILPDVYREIARAWLNFYDDTGYLPRWPSAAEFACMPGTLVEAVLADAVVKDILGRADAERALTAMLKNAEVQSADPRQGRKCVAVYDRLGYVPYTQAHESVNETLDCAYGDWCIHAVAAHLGKTDVAAKYAARAKNYANLFDPAAGFVRAKDERGNFRPEPFDSFAWGEDYTEGSVWQNGFAVPHDIAGLAELYGGSQALIAKMDELFAAPVRYHVGGYGFEIHEMTEFAAADFGQCAISNQPSFHLPYIYAELGEVDKTAAAVRRLVEAFSPEDDGFPGDEDNGTMACWYLFSTIGMYPMCPGRADYTRGVTLFDEVRMVIGGKTVDLGALLAANAANRISHRQILDAAGLDRDGD